MTTDCCNRGMQQQLALSLCTLVAPRLHGRAESCLTAQVQLHHCIFLLFYLFLLYRMLH